MPAEAGGAPAAVRAARLVLDGIVGIGGSGGLRAAAAALVDAATAPRVVAVDLPSGVDADTGAAPGPAVRADVTVTFGALKPGLLVGAGVEHAGEVRLVDIGLGPHLPPPEVRVLDRADVAGLLPVPGPRDDKYTRGVAGVAAGSADLSRGRRAVHRRRGARRRRDGPVRRDRRRARPVPVAGGGGDRGPAERGGPGAGLGGRPRHRHRRPAAELLRDVLGHRRAGAGRRGRAHPGRAVGRSWSGTGPAPTVLTPHDREFERIAGPVGDDRVGAARRAAADLGAVVLLKGNATVVVGPDGLAYVNTTGTPWLATAGSGDVLSGLGGALLAGGLPPALAAAAAAHLHGLAGRLAADGVTTTAAGVLDALPAALRAVGR